MPFAGPLLLWLAAKTADAIPILQTMRRWVLPVLIGLGALVSVVVVLGAAWGAIESGVAMRHVREIREQVTAARFKARREAEAENKQRLEAAEAERRTAAGESQEARQKAIELEQVIAQQKQDPIVPRDLIRELRK